MDLTDAELAAIKKLIKRAIQEDRFPLSPRLDPLRAVLAKLNPAAAAALSRRPTPKSAKPATTRPPAPKGRPRAS